MVAVVAQQQIQRRDETKQEASIVHAANLPEEQETETASVRGKNFIAPKFAMPYMDNNDPADERGRREPGKGRRFRRVDEQISEDFP